MRIDLLDAARDDLAAIQRYIASDSPDAARRTVLGLLDAIERLAEAPYRGHPGRWPDTRELVIRPYVIPYRVQGQTVEVLRVFHGAREWPEQEAA